MPEKVPADYTVKDGDTLFNIAQEYYGDGNKWGCVAKTGMALVDILIEECQQAELPHR